MRSRVIVGALVAGLLLAVGAMTVRGGEAPELLRPFTRGPALRSNEDPLLAAARASIDGAGLSEAARAGLLDSDDPGHARAQRILRAMTAEPEPASEAPPTDPSAVAVVAPTLPPATTAVAPIASKPPTTPTTTSPAPAAATPKPTSGASGAAKEVKTTLNSLALRQTSAGATLTLTASSGVVVGVANQRTSGIVRLIVEARAGTNVLSARPRVQGARVSSVRRVGRSVFVTLTLDPGWSLHRIRRTRAGAKVELRRDA